MTRYVLVHGAFVGGYYWEDVASALRERGHDVTVVDRLPSVSGNDASSLGDLADDIRAVRALLDSLDGPAVLVGHSGGGMVVTEMGDHPKVAHSVFVSAVIPERGQSAMDVLATAGGPTDWVVAGEDGIARVIDDLDRLREVLCADVEPGRARESLSQLGVQSAASLLQPSSAPNRAHPATFVITEHDVVFPAAAQEKWAAAADYVVRIASAHQPMVSVPDELADILARIG
jgi:pimeloyl-ACP methyl ester carboxylesterase